MQFSREGKAMITMETDRLVDDYLRRLDAAAAHLQRSRRAELVGEIREHIETALREEQAADEVAVRNVLERLGPPEEIVEAAEPPARESPARTGKLEIAALVAMVIPFIGWLLGIVLVLVSQAWSSREKLVGVALALTPVIVPLLGFMVAGADGTQGGPVSVEPSVGMEDDNSGSGGIGPLETATLALLFFAGGLPSALYLGWRLRRHPRTSAN
jgi:hypothetical protein